MINVSTTYDNLIANGGQYEWRVAQGNTYYGKENIMGGTITRTEFTRVSVGCCTAATLDLNLWGVSSLSTDTPLTVQFRATDGVTSSEWYTKGIFFIDTIESSPYSEVTHITAYDAMLKTNVVYMTSGTWTQPTTLEVLQDIADDIGVTIEPNTYDLFDILSRTLDISVNIGANGTTERELLSIMGVMYACNFIINDAGQLKATSPGIAQFALANVGDAVVSFDASHAERITKAKVWLNATTYFRTPSIATMTEEQFDALPGVRLEVECPFYASQSISDYLITYFGTKDFIPYNAQGAFLDPKYEIEDSVKIKNITSYITNQSISLDPLAQSNLELESYQALQSHYPYINQAKQEAARNEERIQQVVSEANYREQTIYKSALSGTNTMPAYTTWVTDATGNQNTWTTTRPVYDSAFPVLFVATQRQSVEQSSGTTCSCTTPVKDQTTTIIDGGHITTGTIDAAVVNVTNLDADNIVVGTISDASGVNYWNLDNGELVTQQGQIADFTIYNNKLEAGTYDVGNNSTVIKNGTWSSTFLKPYTHSGQTSWYTHITSIGDAVRFNIASPTDTMQTAKVAGKIEPFYNQSGDFMEMRLYGGNTLMMRLVNDTTPYVSVSQEVQIGGASTPKDLLVTGDIDTDGEYLVQGQPLVDTLPDADASTRGLVSTGDQTFDGKKTFNNRIIANASSTGDGTSGSIVAQSGNPAIVSYNSALSKYIELIAGSSGNRGLYTNDGWVLYLGGDGKLHFGKPVDATNLPIASATEAGIVSTGAQTFAGAKTFTSSPKVSTSGSYADVTLSVSSDSASVEYHGYKANYGGRAYINQTSGKSDGTGKTGYYERYFFPITDANMTSNADYSILTTKTIYTKSDTSSISGVQLRRWGNIVTIFLRGASVNSSGSIGTIPADYRPSAYLYANCVHTAAGSVVRPAQITIESSGTTVISAYNGSNNYGTAKNGYVNGTITFVVN